jgi:catechol 2,3-dioxygenase-like lactoylglutathione lyase family enzyme
VDLDSVQIGAADPAAYRLLLGVEPIPLAGGVYRFQLARGAVEIEPGEPGMQSICFVGTPDAGWPAAFHGLRVLTAPARRTAAAPDVGVAIDHVVVRTPDLERAIDLWRDRAGLRLALDRAFPERGLRLVFFRSGGITLEFASAHAEAPSDAADRFHGVSYRVPDLAARRDRLLRAGIEVSELRAGMRPGTSVVTVRSGTAGVPTLLLEVHG